MVTPALLLMVEQVLRIGSLMSFVAPHSLRSPGVQSEALVLVARARFLDGLNSLLLIQKEGLNPYRSPEP